MKKFVFEKVAFLKSAQSEKGYPKNTCEAGGFLPEIAVAGRSNVGKSSLLNHLFKQKNMVKTSQKPGKTRLLNFFKVDDECVFCDLPGYGYANVLGQVKKTWSLMIEKYLLEREPLKGVLLLLDIRRLPSQEDLQFYEWITYHEIPLLIVFTKWDKLSKNQALTQRKKNLEKLGQPSCAHVHYSVPKNIGRKELIFHLKELLNAPDA